MAEIMETGATVPDLGLHVAACMQRANNPFHPNRIAVLLVPLPSDLHVKMAIKAGADCLLYGGRIAQSHNPPGCALPQQFFQDERTVTGGTAADVVARIE